MKVITLTQSNFNPPQSFYLLAFHLYIDSIHTTLGELSSVCVQYRVNALLDELCHLLWRPAYEEGGVKESVQSTVNCREQFVSCYAG
jgi:hypothetical protein